MRGIVDQSTSIVVARGIGVTFNLPSGSQLPILQDVDLSLGKGEIVGMVGRSGSGKSTLARVMAGLLMPTIGAIEILGRPVVTSEGSKFDRETRRAVQMVFQDPYSSLNPSMTPLQAVEEAVRVWRDKSDDRSVRDIAQELLDDVGIDSGVAHRKPRSLSGGQLQRCSIARALAPTPSLLIADEATSSIDQSSQAQLVTLLQRLRMERQLSILLISHDRALVEYISDRVAVVEHGGLSFRF